MLQLYGVVPPLAASAVEYALPTCPEGSETVLICTEVTAAATLSVNDFVKVITVQELSKVGLGRISKTITCLAGIEGLVAHAESIRARCPDA